MFCPQCGTSQQSGARFCPVCGMALGASAIAPPEGALAPGPLPRQPAGVSTPVSAVARPGLSASQSLALQRQIAAGLLNPYRQRVMGYVGADDRQLLIALLERATKDARFCTALAYVVSTRDVMAFETVLDHPDRTLPLGIEMWAEHQSAGARARSASPAPARSGRSGQTADYVLCPRGHRVPWYAPSCPTCGSAVGATAPPAPPGAPGPFPAYRRDQPLGQSGRSRYGNGRRVFYAGLWGFYTIALVCGFFGGVAQANIGAALLCLVLAAVTGSYAWRIWMYRAKQLWLLILF